ncbi:MAG: PfkB family carbohydrate kinase [Pseudomonadota bacterium]
MTSILVAGVAVLDFVFHMDQFPRLPEKYRASGAAINGGGNAANAAVAIARLDGDAHLASRLGDDQIADMILADLQHEGVRTELVKRHEGRRSSFSSIYIDSTGERQIMNYRDTELPTTGAWMADRAPASLTAILADTRWGDGALAAMELAKARGIPGVMDAEAPVLEAEGAVQAASHVAFSAQGALDFTGLSNVEQAAMKADTMVPGRVIVTDGENGVAMAQHGAVTWFPAFDIRPVDTLGAGDVWHGAFTLALSEGMDEAEAIHFASAAAAIKCERKGGRDGAPKRQEVSEFLRDRT